MSITSLEDLNNSPESMALDRVFASVDRSAAEAYALIEENRKLKAKVAALLDKVIQLEDQKNIALAKNLKLLNRIHASF